MKPVERQEAYEGEKNTDKYCSSDVPAGSDFLFAGAVNAKIYV